MTKFNNHRKDYISWDEYFMGVAILSSMRSKDPSTPVGACIVSKDNRILSMGYNGTPNGVEDDSFNWDREGDFLESKYAYVVHAEANALINFKGNTREFEGAKIYVTLSSCNECSKLLAQAGIKEVIYLSDKYCDVKEFIAGKKLLDSCNIKYKEFKTSNDKIELNFK